MTMYSLLQLFLNMFNASCHVFQFTTTFVISVPCPVMIRSHQSVNLLSALSVARYMMTQSSLTEFVRLHLLSSKHADTHCHQWPPLFFQA